MEASPPGEQGPDIQAVALSVLLGEDVVHLVPVAHQDTDFGTACPALVSDSALAVVDPTAQVKVVETAGLAISTYPYLQRPGS